MGNKLQNDTIWFSQFSWNDKTFCQITIHKTTKWHNYSGKKNSYHTSLFERPGFFESNRNFIWYRKIYIKFVVHEICSILTKNIAPDLIRFPTEKDAVSETASTFIKRFGFPQVFGCVSGTHIPIKQLSENSHDYFLYKMSYSINCQAIWDVYGQFTIV